MRWHVKTISAKDASLQNNAMRRRDLQSLRNISEGKNYLKLRNDSSLQKRIEDLWRSDSMRIRWPDEAVVNEVV